MGTPGTDADLAGGPRKQPCGSRADGVSGVQLPAQGSREAAGTHGDPREQTPSPGVEGTWGADPNRGGRWWQGHQQGLGGTPGEANPKPLAEAHPESR